MAQLSMSNSATDTHISAITGSDQNSFNKKFWIKTSLLKKKLFEIFSLSHAENPNFQSLGIIFYNNKMKVSEGITVYSLSMSEALEWTESFKVPLIPKQSINTHTYTLTTWFSRPYNHFSSIIFNMINIFHFLAPNHISFYLQLIHSRVYQESTTASEIFQNLWENTGGPVCSFWKIPLFSCTAIFLQCTKPTNPLAYCTKIFK